MSPAGPRHCIENTFYRALLVRLRALTPRTSKPGDLLERARPFYDCASDPPSRGDPLPFATIHGDSPHDTGDPLGAAVQRNARAQELGGRLVVLMSELRTHLDRAASRHLSEYEQCSQERAEIVNGISFSYGFRLGQIWPRSTLGISQESTAALRRLARAATDVRAPPASRLRVMLLASTETLEELADASAREAGA